MAPTDSAARRPPQEIKEKLLENGARWEAEIARNLELDAPYR